MKLRSLLLFLVLASCGQNDSERPDEHGIFTLLSPRETGLDFSNDLTYTEKINTYTYRNFYNGAGIALGDINNDGLPDIYLSGNQTDNKLYLNKGNWKFEDITARAGVAATDSWSTGVSMADVNGDGLIDIYVCKSGPPNLSERSASTFRHNQLFINNGDLTFTDKARTYEVADEGLSTHAAFFDYDKDGDLDMYLLNNSTRPIGAYDLKIGRREERDPEGANKLYRNDGNKFTDVSESAGIYGSAIGYGLGVTVGDVNRDGWQDIFISNDFFERDYLYINNTDGTFSEQLTESMPEISMGSMGADMGDLNNDGWPEVYVTEMLPDSLSRIKTKTVFENWDKYQANVRNGYHHQFTRNALQLNNGVNSSGEINFSEISRLTGLDATDWSWGALIFDYNNDGLKDIFVANGIYKDLMDHDYVNFYANNSLFISKYKADSTVLTNLISKIPSTPLRNYLFRNDGELKFSNTAAESGLDHKGFSNGAAYGDMDNDGDLDLIVNNINDHISVYRNDLNEGHSIRFQLEGNSRNTAAIGTQVTVYTNGDQFYQEQSPVKGYLSSIDTRMHFGVGASKTIDSVIFRWPDDRISKLTNLKTDSLYVIKEADQVKIPIYGSPAQKTILKALDEREIINYTHVENNFIDFNRNRLAFEMISAEGPHTALGDVNNDGRTDIYIGGAKEQPGRLMISSPDGTFLSTNESLFETDKKHEDSQSVFFDADGDGDTDLYVGSGSIEYPRNSLWYKDRLYLNDGNGNFKKSEGRLPDELRQSTSFVKAVDYDQDGDQDLFIGTRAIAAQYGLPGDIIVLKNDRSGTFSKVTGAETNAFRQIGMTKEGEFADLDNDGDMDLLVAGEWMPLTIFIYDSGRFRKHELSYTSGFWNTITIADINYDGLPDILAGNHGMNTRYNATPEKPLRLYVNDFDNNGSVEQIITQFDGDTAYPIVMLQDLIKQMPPLRKKLPTYQSYSKARIDQLFTPEIMDRSVIREIQQLETVLLINKGGLKFEKQKLPDQIQYSQVHAITVADVTGDGFADLIVGGNQMKAKPEWGTYAATRGQLFAGDGKGGFNYLPELESGIGVEGEIRKIDVIARNDDRLILFWRNGEAVKKYKVE